jgi:hypothetical protein
LYVLTDDNSPAIQDVRSHAEYGACLLSIAQKDNAANDVLGDPFLHLRVLACGMSLVLYFG